MTEIKRTGGFNESWNAIEQYLTSGEGLPDVVIMLGSMAVDAVTIEDVSFLSGRLGRLRDKLNYDGYELENAQTLIHILEGLLQALERQNLSMRMQINKANYDNRDSLILEEIAFAQAELDVVEIPVWMQVEIKGRYSPLPTFMREWVQEERDKLENPA